MAAVEIVFWGGQPPSYQRHLPQPPIYNMPLRLLNKTFVIEHNPNCPSRWLVRLPGLSAVIDHKRFETKDAIGYGQTLYEATTNALTDQQKRQGGTSEGKCEDSPG